MNYIIDGEGKKRQAGWLNCDNCAEEFLRPTRFLKRKRKNVFCSKSCQFSFHQQDIKCSYCDKTFQKITSKVSDKFNFCSRRCKDVAQRVDSGPKFNSLRPDHYKDGKYNYRQIALRDADAICNRCGYDKSLYAIVVHHTDRNRENNNLDNLEILCRNCHAIEHLGVLV